MPYNCETINVYDTVYPCQKQVLNDVAGYPEELRDDIIYDFWIERGSTECRYTLYNAPIMGTVYNDSRCPAFSCPEPLYGTCRHPAFLESLDPNACGTDAGPFFSAPGQSVDALKSDPKVQVAWKKLLNLNGSVPTPAVEFGSTRCLTCEDKPLDNPAQTQQQARELYNCLDGMLGAQNDVAGLPEGAPLSGVSRPALANQLVERLKLLFERKGSLLSDGQQARILQLYNTDPYKSVRLDCPSPFTPPPVTSACGDLGNLNQQLGFCSLLEPAHVPRSARDSYLSQCLGLASDITLIPVGDACSSAAYRDSFFSLMASLVTRQVTPLSLSTPTAGEPVVDPQQLHYALRAMDTWYVNLRSELSSDPVLFKERVGNKLPGFLSTFWDAAYATRVHLDTEIPSLPAEQLTDYLDTYLGNVSNLSMAVERDVLRAALPVSGPPPMTSSALVLVMGEAFTGLTHRLESLRPLHDLGCRFKRCSPTEDSSQMSQLWGLLANLDDAGRLQTQLGKANQVGVNWREVFTQIQRNHTTVANAVRDSLLENPVYASKADSWKELLSSGLPESMSPGMVPLAQHIQQALARTRSHERTGLLEPTLQNTLYRGIQEAQQEQTISRVKSDNDNLGNKLDTYSANRKEAVVALQQEISTRSGQSRLLAELQQKVSELEEFSRNQAALRHNIEVQQARYALFAQILNQQLKKEAGDNRVAYDRVSRTLADVTADNARRDTSQGKSGVEVVSFYKWPGTGPGNDEPSLSIKKGDVVNFDTSGSWSPTCALQTAQQAPFITNPIVVSSQGRGFTTGPEGFSISTEGSTFKASATERVNQNGTFYSKSNSYSDCAGAEMSLNIGHESVPVFSARAYERVESCYKSDHGTSGGVTNSTSSTLGGESRQTASFHRGLRLQNTPFPDMPVGSLLAVVMKRGATALDHASILDIHVVQSPYTSFSVQEDADVYLVVNDKTGCAVDTSVGLNVTMTRVRPLGSVVAEVATQMAKTLLDIRSQTDDFLASGRLLPSDKAQLRSTALLQLGGLTNFPDIMSIYEAWLDAELAVLEKKVEARTVELSMARLVLETRALNEQLQLSNAELRMTRKVSSWALRELDADTLSGYSLLVLNKVMSQLYPIVDLRHPGVFETLTGDYYEDQLDKLIQIKVEDTLRLHVQSAHDLVTDLIGVLEDARGGTPSLVPTQVALRFPRPVIVPSHPRQPSLFRTADTERSAALWAAVDNKTRASIVLTPADLYAAGVSPGSSKLGCNEAAPVIDAMGIHFVWINPLAKQRTESENIRVNVEFDQSLVFPREDGPVSYFMDTREWTTFNVKTTYDGSIANAGSRFLNYAAPTRVANGLSPFTKFSIDFSSPDLSGLWEADDIILFFTVSVRPVEQGGLGWLENCQ
ncbi:hypothetical protein [Cystobacter fuscus]|uniref:hypothetical protein n=1 Tax=Cystobacter fuscus TaxID=43 RepID=UPI0012DEFF19|nr:hypothetical protein [Cystobacter fuscus]